LKKERKLVNSELNSQKSLGNHIFWNIFLIISIPN